ncbi:hypothetical protein D3C71_1550470 [compost metagenome]
MGRVEGGRQRLQAGLRAVHGNPHQEDKGAEQHDLAILGGHRHNQQGADGKAGGNHFVGIPTVHQPTGHQDPQRTAKGEQRRQDRRLLKLIPQPLHQQRHPTQQYVVDHQPHKIGEPQHQCPHQVGAAEQQADAGLRQGQLVLIQVETGDMADVMADKALGNLFDFSGILTTVNHVFHRFRQQQDQQHGEQ